ncbi:MAG: type II secretion system GspH family protein [Fervidobacterium sp.]|nr:type II secretion system GspH family protein [Fervidobacterium sp.]
MKNGFSLIESIVAVFMISLIFLAIASGLSSILLTIVSIQNMQKTTEFENFIARWVYIQSDFSTIVEDVNRAFYGTNNPINYPKVRSVALSNVSNYFDKFTFEIEYLANKVKYFTVYKYRAY